jgi:regulator of sirC expression with transglutaminase-like and TPR domain
MGAKTRDARARFTALVAGAERAIDLAEAALWIAAEAYPELDVAHYLHELDALAASAAVELRGIDGDAPRVRHLVHFLSVAQRFRGNQDDYYDRRNSFLNEVLDRRTGIPITLALVYTEVARRFGLRLTGVGFPGHFLVKYAGPPELLIDPFFGRLLTPQECERRLQAVLGDEARLRPSHLTAAKPREILVRMLRNLKQIAVGARDLDAALSYTERILLVVPDLADEVRDRGLLYAELECYAAARADLERFLVLAPNDPSAAAVRDRLLSLAQATTLH